MSGLRGVGNIKDNFNGLPSFEIGQQSGEAVDWEDQLYSAVEKEELQRWMKAYNRRNGPGRYSGLGDD